MVRMENIAEQNAWWRDSINFEYQDPDLSKIITFIDPLDVGSRKKLELEPNNIYMIRGPRRVGKTTYVKQIIGALIKRYKKTEHGSTIDGKQGIDPKHILYLNIERLNTKSAKELQKTITLYFNEILEKGVKYVFLDEITACGPASEWAGVLQGFHDSGTFNDVAVILTGSDPVSLEDGAHKLAGRNISGNDFLFRPLTFRDFLFFVLYHSNYFKRILENYGINQQDRKRVLDILSTSISLNEDIEKIKKVLLNIENASCEREFRILFDIYLRTGGFLQAIAEYFSNVDKEIDERISGSLYEDTLRAILEKLSIVEKNPITADRIINKIALLKAASGGTNYSTISGDVGIRVQTTQSYIYLLNKLLIVDVLDNYTEKLENRRSYTKKIYVSDPFILHSLRARASGSRPYSYSLGVLQKEEYKAEVVEMVVGNALRASEEVPILKEPNTYLFFYRDKKGEIDFIFKTIDSSVVGVEVSYQEEPSTADVKKRAFVKNYIQLTKHDTANFGDIIQVPVHIFLAFLKKSEKCL